MVSLTLLRGGNKREQGFTLVELLITITIVGILSTIGIASYTRITGREKVNAVTIGLAGWIDQVRKASTLGSSCTATINKAIAPDSIIATAALTSTTETAIERSMCVPAFSMSEVSGPSSSSSTYSINSNNMSGTQTVVQFTPRGTLVLPSGNSSIDITVQLLPSGPSRCISIKDLIANIAISKGEDCSDQERF